MQPRDRLTAREIQVATLVWQGLTNKDIARVLLTSEQVVKSLSATMVAARATCILVGFDFGISHTKISGSTILIMIATIFSSSAFSAVACIRRGMEPSISIHLTMFGCTPANPIKRSRAIGGHVDIRRMGRIWGCSCKKSARRRVRLLVSRSADSTFWVAFARLLRNALGAKLINQSLYMSTERTMSAFQKSGLSLFTIGTACPFYSAAESQLTMLSEILSQQQPRSNLARTSLSKSSCSSLASQ